MTLGKRLAELDRAATEGPWEVFELKQGCEHATVVHAAEWSVGVPTPGYPGGNYRDTDFGGTKDDAELIAALKSNLPQILQALAVQEAFEQVHGPHHMRSTLTYERSAEILADWTKEIK